MDCVTIHVAIHDLRVAATLSQPPPPRRMKFSKEFQEINFSFNFGKRFSKK